MEEVSTIEIIVPMLFSFWFCVAYVIFAIFMIGIWVCIGIAGGPCMRLKPPKVPPMPPLPKMSDM